MLGAKELLGWGYETYPRQGGRVDRNRSRSSSPSEDGPKGEVNNEDLPRKKGTRAEERARRAAARQEQERFRRQASGDVSKGPGRERSGSKDLTDLAGRGNKDTLEGVVVPRDRRPKGLRDAGRDAPESNGPPG